MPMGMTILIYRRKVDINKYYLKIADIIIYVELEFNIEIKKESVNFLCNEINHDYNIMFKFKKINTIVKIQLINKSVIRTSK